MKKFRFALLFAMSLCISQTAHADINDGLVGHWSFDEGAGSSAADSSSGGNTGSLNGGVKWDTGKDGTAITFDGTSGYVKFSETQGLPAYKTGAVTSVAFWVKGPAQAKYVWTESGAGSSSLYCLLADNGTSGISGSGSGKLVMQVRTDASSTRLLKATKTMVFDNTWHHVVWVDNAGTAAMYIDGVKDASDFNYTPSGTLTATTDCVGALCRSSVSNFFNGSIDDVRVYNRALSPSDVTELYNQGLNAMGTAPVPDAEFPSITPPADVSPAPPTPPSSTPSGSLVTPHLILGDLPPKDWYGGPDNILGYDILHMAFTRDDNGPDNVIAEWSFDGVNWSTNGNSYSTSIIVPALPYNVKVYYRARARRGNQYSEYSNVLPITTLYPPAHLSVSTQSTSAVYLTWDYRAFHDINGNEYEVLPGSGYKIERSTDPTFPTGDTKTIVVSQPYTMIDNIYSPGRKLVTYVDNDNFDKVPYYYRVRAFTTVGDGEASKAASIAPSRVPDQIDFANAYTYRDSTNKQSSNNVAVYFRTATNGQTGYRIERSNTGTDGWTTLKTYGLTIPSDPYIDRGLTPGSTYYYRVVAFNPAGDSSYKLLKVDVPNIASVLTTLWYVDNTVSDGLNDGTSWVNAWHNFSSINWYAIKPGDTIYISGGVNGQSYDERLFVMKGGSDGSPVTIKVGIDAAHHGQVTMNAGVFLRAAWVTIDGAKDPAFKWTTIGNIVDNQNIEIMSADDFSCVYSNAPEGTRILWIHAHNCGNAGPLSMAGNVSGILFNGNSGIGVRGTEVAYNHMNDVWGQGIGVSGPAENYGNGSIHHNLIDHVRNDFIITSGGMDIYNNLAHTFIEPKIGHPDGFQIWPPYVRIYNNTIYDTPGTLIYIELAVPDASHIQIYNNVMYPDQLVENSAITFTTEPPAFLDTMQMRDVLIANNLVYNLNKGNLSLNRRDSSVGTLQIRNMTVKNNLFYLPSDATSGSSYLAFDDGPQTGYDYSSDDLVFNNNIIASSINNALKINNVFYHDLASFNSATLYNGAHPANFSSAPQLKDPAGFDFRLSASDTIARGKGADLSTYRDSLSCGPNGDVCPTPPDIDKDITGTPRAPGAWDIGPYQYIDGTTPVKGSGDVSGDGRVTMHDAALLLRYISLGARLNDPQKQANLEAQGDFNGDGKIDMVDVVAIARKALGL